MGWRVLPPRLPTEILLSHAGSALGWVPYRRDDSSLGVAVSRFVLSKRMTVDRRTRHETTAVVVDRSQIPSRDDTRNVSGHAHVRGTPLRNDAGLIETVPSVRLNRRHSTRRICHVERPGNSTSVVTSLMLTTQRLAVYVVLQSTRDFRGIDPNVSLNCSALRYFPSRQCSAPRRLNCAESARA